MKIECNKIEKVPLSEGVMVEFKTSIFHSAGKTPQMEVIAKTIAGFINSSGGELFLGVRDDGVIKGVDSDLDTMARADLAALVDGPYCCDAGFSYKRTIDHYYLKVQKIVEAYIGKDALRFLGDAKEVTAGDVRYLIVPIKKAGLGEYVRFRGKGSRFSEIVVRTPGATRVLIDEDRDEFVKRKERELHLEGESIVSAVESILGKHGEDLKKLLGRYDESEQEKTSAIVAEPEKEIPQANGENSETHLPISGQDLVSQIKKALAKVAADRKSENSGADYNVSIDLHDSLMELMDSFQEKFNNQYIWGRMYIGKYSPKFYSLPYDKINGHYELKPDVDFELSDIRWRVNRTKLNEEEQAVMISLGRLVSISQIKKSETFALSNFAWGELLKKCKDEPFGKEIEIDFDEIFLLRANTTDSWEHGGRDNVYQITGLKFVKQPLRECPKSTEGLDWCTVSRFVR